MTTVASFTLTGDAEINALLDQWGNAARGEMLENAVMAGALPIVNQAKVNLATTPSITGRGSITVTGNLERSIHIGGHGTETGLVSPTTGTDIGGNKHTETAAEVWVGTNAEYARRVEFGFMGQDALGRRYHQAAQPYLRPAFDENRETFRKEVVAAIQAQLRHFHGS